MAKDGVWGGFTEIAACSPMPRCPVEIHGKSDGTFKQLFEFGPKNGTDQIARVVFTGGDHYRYLEAGGPGLMAVGQGPSADPPTADSRAEDPDFAAAPSSVGRCSSGSLLSEPGSAAGSPRPVRPPPIRASLGGCSGSTTRTRTTRTSSWRSSRQSFSPQIRRDISCTVRMSGENLKSSTKTSGRAFSTAASTARIEPASKSFTASRGPARSRSKASRRSSISSRDPSTPTRSPASPRRFGIWRGCSGRR